MINSLTGRSLALLLMLCVAWSTQPIAIKLAASQMSPLLQISLRSAVGALVMLSLSLRNKSSRWHKGLGKLGLTVGILFTIEFFCISEGIRLTSSTHIIVLLYSAPIFSAITLHFRIPDERLTVAQWAGISMAFFGLTIAILFSSGHEVDSHASLKGDLWGLGAGISWGLTTFIIRGTRLSRAPVRQVAFYQLAIAGLGLAVVAVTTNDVQIHFTAVVFKSLAYQVFVLAVAGYLVWFWLLANYPASQLGAISLLAPLMGVVWGAIWLGEPLTTPFLLGCASVFLGLLLVVRPRLVASIFQGLAQRRSARVR